MKVRILPPAVEDLVNAGEFYEKQGPGLGNYFIETLFGEIDSLTIYAGIHPLHSGFHRLLSKRFPYAIYYRVSEEEVLVFRVLDGRRDPRLIRSELKKMG